MSDWLLVVDVMVDPQVEEKWNEWYDRKHLPEIVDCPGFLKASRYRTEGDGSRRYLTVYEVTGPEALQSEEFRNRRGWGEYASNVQPQVNLYRRISQRSKA